VKRGLVIKSTGKLYHVKADDGSMIHCQIKGKLRLKNVVTTNPIAAGDVVEYEPEPNSQGSIVSIVPRKNYIIRKSVNLSKEAQIVAANIDMLFLVVTIARPQTSAGFIDRFLASAEAYEVPASIVFHKMDQYNEKEAAKVEELIGLYTRIGYPCLRTSLVDGRGLEEMKEKMQGGVNLFSGHSGTGKSSLINYFIPGLELKTAEISDWSDKGQHTTTFSELHALPFGGYIADTPGIKGFGLVDIPVEEVHHHFREFFQLLPKCRFANCRHTNEPGCAVREAVATGEVAESRYKSYLSILEDESERSTYR